MTQTVTRNPKQSRTGCRGVADESEEVWDESRRRESGCHRNGMSQMTVRKKLIHQHSHQTATPPSQAHQEAHNYCLAQPREGSGRIGVVPPLKIQVGENLKLLPRVPSLQALKLQTAASRQASSCRKSSHQGACSQAPTQSNTSVVRRALLLLPTSSQSGSRESESPWPCSPRSDSVDFRTMVVQVATTVVYVDKTAPPTCTP
ncbi:hypothetical protein B0H12DRAFT_1074595 [Mycena haematopus]|nr:hypothetical protein B0H12DRAFT_1074595 [Mycena haematopus]